MYLLTADEKLWDTAKSSVGKDDNLFYCVREHSGELIEKLRYVLNCREDFDRLKHIISEKAEIGDVQRAANFCLARYNYFGVCFFGDQA